MTMTLLPGYSTRSPTLEDLEAIAGLLNTCAVAEHSAPIYTAEYLRSDWTWPRFQPATDAWIVLTSDGQAAGYAAVWLTGHEQIAAEVYVHPEQCGLGIGTHLRALMETRARQLAAEMPPGKRDTLHQQINAANDAARHLLEQAGYTFVYRDWHMALDLHKAPPAPVWPTGITLRAFVPGQDDRAVHTATEEAFQYNTGYLPISFERWSEQMIQREGFDPRLWFLALAGSEIAGVALCRDHRNQEEQGWVSVLAVRQPWRGQGLGMALLRHAFGEFYRRGKREAGLSVDSQNITGATRLYERAGMRIAQQHDHYQKALRPEKMAADP
jgi:mycothiol synthase